MLYALVASSEKESKKFDTISVPKNPQSKITTINNFFIIVFWVLLSANINTRIPIVTASVVPRTREITINSTKPIANKVLYFVRLFVFSIFVEHMEIVKDH